MDDAIAPSTTALWLPLIAAILIAPHAHAQNGASAQLHVSVRVGDVVEVSSVGVSSFTSSGPVVDVRARLGGRVLEVRGRAVGSTVLVLVLAEGGTRMVEVVVVARPARPRIDLPLHRSTLIRPL